MSSDRIGELLVRQKLISLQQLRKAQEEQQREGTSLGYALAKMGFVSDAQITDFLSQQYRVQAIDLPPDLSVDELSEPSPGVAMAGVVMRGTARFDAALVRIFLQHLGLYPLGSYVELDDGQIAKVVATNPDATKRPIVEIVRDAQGMKPAHPVYVDLLRTNDRNIARAVSSEILES